MGTTPGLKLRYPELTDTADGPTGISNLGLDVENYVYNRQLPSGVTRYPGYHWGSVSGSFPSGAFAGDTVWRSDVGTSGSLWRYTGNASQGTAGWVCSEEVTTTSTTRPLTSGANSAAYRGFRIFETDTGESYRWDGSAWRPQGRVVHNVAVNTAYFNATNIHWTQYERLVRVVGTVVWINSPNTMNAWDNAVVASGFPAATSSPSVLAPNNGFENAELMVNVDSGGVLRMVNRWTAHTIPAGMWLDISQTYLVS